MSTLRAFRPLFRLAPLRTGPRPGIGHTYASHLHSTGSVWKEDGDSSGAASAREKYASKLLKRINTVKDPRLTETYRSKYEEQLKKKANEAGVSVDTLLDKVNHGEAKLKAKEIKGKELNTTEANGVMEKTSEPLSESMATGSTTSSKGTIEHQPGNLPPDTKPLSSILRLELIDGLGSEAIVDLWNGYHAQKDLLVSAAIPVETYTRLHANTREYPLFIVPLPRDGQGVEFYFLQNQGHQTFFTSLIEYRTHGSNSRPHLVLTHYTDLVDRTGLVLMRGEVADKVPLKTEEAAILVHGLQKFYVTGGPEALEQLKNFKERPTEFDYRKVMDIMDRVDV